MVRVLRVRPVSQNTLRIQFDKRVLDDPFFLDPDNYILTGGLVPLAVMICTDNIVELQTTPQATDQPYELTMKDGQQSQENKAATG